VRCCECEIEPLTPGHFCECCGRKLSLQERRALDAQPPVDPVPAARLGYALVDPILEAHFAGHAPVEAAPAVPAAANAHVEKPHASQLAAPGWTEPASLPSVNAYEPVESMYAQVPAAHLDSDAPDHRCEICGAHAHDADLCEACQRTYHSLLESKTFPLPVEAEAPADPEMARAAVIASEGTVPAIEAPAAPVHSLAVEAPVPIRVRPVPDVAVAVAPTPPPEPEPAAAPPPPPPPTPNVTKPVKPVTPPAAVMAPASARPGNARTVAAAAAVLVVVAAIGFPLGKLWLGQQEAAIVRVEQPQPAEDRQASGTPATPPDIVQVSATTAVAAVQAPPKATALAPPPTAPAAASRAIARVPSKTAQRPSASARPVAAAVVPSPVATAVVPEIAAPAPVVAPAPKPEPPAAPVGPFFELRDVNETPRVATRVEPQVPEELRGRSLNEVVIVRVLVTQAGQPLIVNLLRRSKAGASLDEAIVAAVKQWTFVPARKRGAAVSCWYHVGVPVIKTP
jgi:TonB family protein